jgi:Primase X
MTSINTTYNTSEKIYDKREERNRLVSEGVDLFLSIFGLVGQRLFPRTIMTKFTGGQVVVNSKEEMMNYFMRANFQDCRINAYPAFLSKAEEQDYIKGINQNLFTPNILFIDLDLEHFASKKELDKWLKEILNNISEGLKDSSPIVLWSGNGYHIIIPVYAPEALEQFEEFQQYTREPSKEFLQFAEKSLSLGKADASNNPGFKSCLLRVPNSLNTKHLDEGLHAEVRIMEPFQIPNTETTLPKINNLLTEFMTYLVDKDLKSEVRSKLMTRRRKNTSENNSIPYVEKLLGLRLTNHRKFAISLILAPYFANIKCISENESFDRIREWVLRCNEMNYLHPSVRFFEELIKKSIQRARLNSEIKPMSFERTLKFKNNELYQLLRQT